MDNSPYLIEPGVRYFIGETLKECYKFKERHINILYNIGMTFMFIITVATLLVYKFKGRLTPSEIALKNQKNQEYIVSKLQQISIHKNLKNYNENMITDLPILDNCLVN